MDHQAPALLLHSPRGPCPARAGLALLVASLALSCDTGPDDAVPAGMMAVEIPFDAVIGDRPWSCGETFMLGTPAVEARPSHLRIFIYDVALVDASGKTTLVTLRDSEWQGNFDDVGHNVVLLDYDDDTGNCRTKSDPETNTHVSGWAPQGDYVGLSFRIGVPSELNHLDAGFEPPPLNRPGMWWAWKDGHMLMRAEFDTEIHDSNRPQTADDTSHPTGWAIWLAEAGYGPQACVAEGGDFSCPNSFQPKIALEPFDITGDRVALDLAALLDGVELGRTEFDEWPADDEPEVTDPTITPYPMPDYYGGFFMDRVDGEGAVILGNLGIDWMTMSPPDPAKQTFARRTP